MQHVEMCAGGDLMEKTLTEAAQLLQKVSKAAAMQKVTSTQASFFSDFGEPIMKVYEVTFCLCPYCGQEVTKGAIN
jgi:hypothetical protein